MQLLFLLLLLVVPFLVLTLVNRSTRVRPLRFKPLLTAVLGCGVFSGSVPAQSLLEKRFRVETEAEVLLDLTAAAPRASWAEAGSESAVATVFVDGQYNQDIFLFAGERAFAYRVLVGTFNLDSTRCESTSINPGPRCLFTSNRLSCDSHRRSKCSSGKVRIKN